jgi:hypothetical protein
MLIMHRCKFGCMPGLAEDENDRSGGDKMDEMLDAIRTDLETNYEEPPTLEMQKFF